MDMEARKASVVTLRQHIGQREERLAEISNDILALDKRLETVAVELGLAYQPALHGKPPPH